MVFIVVEKINGKDIKELFTKFENVKTDTSVFRLYYKFSVWLLVIYSLLYLSVYWNHAIRCFCEDQNDQTHAAAGVYCWTHGTYTITNFKNPTRQIFPGVGGITGVEDQVQYNYHFKYMYYYNFAMILLLVFPRYIWREIENGNMKALLKKISDNLLCIDRNENEAIQKEMKLLVEYLQAHVGFNRRYAAGFILCECLNFLVSLIMLLWWDAISHHQLSGSGFPGLHLSKNPRDRTDGLARAFPILGKCTFNEYAPGGNILPHDCLCLLPLNRFNEIAAVIFWYYFIALSVVGGCAVLFRMAAVCFKRVRLGILVGQLPLMAREDVQVLVDSCSYSDWFLLSKIGAALEPTIFRQIMQSLASKMRFSRF